jgi:hypothetical protein
VKKKQHIPPGRIIAYAILASLTIVLASFLWMTSTIGRAEEAKRELSSLGERLKGKTKQQETNRQIINHYLGKDSLFLHKKLESYQLLSSEVAKLKAQVETSALPEDVLLERRLQALTHGENNFSFVESSTEVEKFYKEVVEHQTKTVEVDTPDLFNLLDIIEGAQEADTRPDLIISEARLEKHRGTLQETWNLTFNIVRREYLS